MKRLRNALLLAIALLWLVGPATQEAKAAEPRFFIEFALKDETHIWFEEVWPEDWDPQNHQYFWYHYCPDKDYVPVTPNEMITPQAEKTYKIYLKVKPTTFELKFVDEENNVVETANPQGADYPVDTFHQTFYDNHFTSPEIYYPATPKKFFIAISGESYEIPLKSREFDVLFENEKGEKLFESPARVADYKTETTHQQLYLDLFDRPEVYEPVTPDGKVTPLKDGKYTVVLKAKELPNRFHVSRTFGKSRFDTAVEISKASRTTSDVALVVNSHRYPDVLSATVLATMLDGPILLTEANALNPTTLAELRRLKVKEVVLVGGEIVLSPAVENALKKEFKVERLFGKSRYDTANEIAKRVQKLADNKSTIIVTRGDDYPDALAVAYLAYRKEAAVVLTKPKEMTPETRALIAASKPDEIFIAGGELAVSKAIEADLKTIAPVTRYGGNSRYETATILAEVGHPTADTVVLASGEAYIDALAVGPMASPLRSPILLTRTKTLPAETRLYLQDHKTIQTVMLVGGELAISPAVEQIVKTMK